jgi:hypothetical protein
VRHVVAPGDFPGWFAGTPALQGFALLVNGEFRLPAHFHATGFGKLSTLASPYPDQLALELCQTTQNY